jgi:hypothetical protein
MLIANNLFIQQQKPTQEPQKRHSATTKQTHLVRKGEEASRKKTHILGNHQG